ncbi:hypothetical protein N750_14220 [Legionella pneumophila str. Leg01/53]|nr:hypothetical protein N750_14220 [Legionella pneumophila str. Leg01/53]
MVPADAKLLKQAKSLRKRSTDAENCLWYYLRAHRIKRITNLKDKFLLEIILLILFVFRENSSLNWMVGSIF